MIQGIVMALDCNEVITSRLWVGRFVRLEEISLLKQLEITNVLNLQSDDDLRSYSISVAQMLQAYADAAITIHRLPIPDFDSATLARQIPDCVHAIQAALTPRCARIYLHCTAGINRAPTAAAAYLMQSQGMSAQEAYDYVTARRHCSPFLDALRQFGFFLQEAGRPNRNPQ